MREIPVDELVPYSNNARTHSDRQIEKIRSSLREFGFVNPLIIDREKNVIAGHGRLEAAMLEGYDRVPCVFVENMTEEQKKAYILADNRLALDAGWDMDALKIEFEQLSDMEFDLDLTGFDLGEIESLLDIEGNDGEEEEEEEGDLEESMDGGDGMEEERQAVGVSRTGDIWDLGPHRVVCGDATDSAAYDTLMQGRRANLVLTDPPYNIGYEDERGRNIRNDKMGNDEFYKFLLDSFKLMEANMANDGSIYVFHSDKEGLNFRRAFNDAGFYFSGCCIWKKNILLQGRNNPYKWIHEPCLFGWKKKGKHLWYSDMKQTTVWEFDRPRRSKLHPTMKPVPLMSYPIKNSTMTNGIVLDPFLGSGSTLIACVETERVCRGIELEPRYVDVAVNRYIECRGTEDVFLTRDGTKMPFSEIAEKNA